MSLTENIIFILTFAAVIFVLILTGKHEIKKWDEFTIAHHCKIVSHTSGDVFNTIDANGKIGIGITDSKTGWLCDDGITYYK